MFSRMKKSELDRLDSSYEMGLVEGINKARELGEQLRLQKITKEEHDMLLTSLRHKAKERK